MRGFRELKVWEKSPRLVLDIYEATGKFPREETHGLTAQLRRSCASIPANIAEGCGRSGDAELGRFMLITMGSANELEYHLPSPGLLAVGAGAEADPVRQPEGFDAGRYLGGGAVQGELVGVELRADGELAGGGQVEEGDPREVHEGRSTEVQDAVERLSQVA
jgi:hypothetical protein